MYNMNEWVEFCFALLTYYIISIFGLNRYTVRDRTFIEHFLLWGAHMVSSLGEEVDWKTRQSPCDRQAMLCSCFGFYLQCSRLLELYVA